LACYYTIKEKYRDNKGNYKLTFLALLKSKSYYTLARHLIKVDEQEREKKETTAGRGCNCEESASHMVSRARTCE
jgi:hypothetical protein